MAADVNTLIGATQELKLRADELARAIYTTGRAMDPAEAPPHWDLYLIGVSGSAAAAREILQNVETALEEIPR
jgi:hypothetical protein